MIDCGASLDVECSSAPGRKIKFLDFIKECGDDYTKQKKIYLTFYKLIRSENLEEYFDTLKFIHQIFAQEYFYPDRHSVFEVPCSSLKELIEQKNIEKLFPEVGKKLVYEINGNLQLIDPMVNVASFLTIQASFKILGKDLGCTGQETLDT